MTSTVIARITAWSGLPRSIHATTVRIAAPSANQNSQPAAVSARRCAREEELCASETSLRIPASAVSSPMALTSRRSPESVATVPATTPSPTSRRTVVDSPVIMDSSMLAAPSTIVPSAGTEAPGRTMTVSPTASSDGSTVTISSPSTLSASSGRRAASESSAELVWASERISTQWPSSMITTSSASSHQKSSCGSSRPRVEPQEARKATVIASAMSSIIPGCRERTSETPPVRNGLPPHTYRTVPSTGGIHETPPLSGTE